MTVRRSIGPADTYPGGPRALARDVGLYLPGGCASYADVEDAAVMAYAARSGKARLVITATLPDLPLPVAPSRPSARPGSPSKARTSTARQRGTQ